MCLARRLLCALLVCFTASPGRAAADTLDEIYAVAARMHDVVATAETCDVNPREFQRLKGNAQVLQFRRLQVYYKLPDRFRVDSRASSLLRISMIQNGDRRTFRTSIGLSRSQDLSDEPARKQGPLDFGMLAPSLWSEYRFQMLGEESVDGLPCLLVKLTLIQDPGYGHHKLWLDCKTYRIVRREKYNGEGVLKVRYVYKEPVRSEAGVWYSRRIELYSPEGSLVGALELRDVRINEGLRDELFR